MSALVSPPDAGLHDVTDDRGNRLVAPAALLPRLNIQFRGRDCLLQLDPATRIGTLTIEFNGDRAQCRLGAAGPEGSFSGLLRLGEDSRILIGDGTTATARCFLCASEGATLRIGEDCMLASDVQLRCDDAHPIFDVHSGERINPSEDIVIGDHVWLAYGTRCMGGTVVGDGSVIGLDSVVTGEIPNNCVALGRPARVTRRDIAWERPHLSHPPARPNADSVTRSRWWHPTRD